MQGKHLIRRGNCFFIGTKGYLNSYQKFDPADSEDVAIVTQLFSNMIQEREKLDKSLLRRKTNGWIQGVIESFKK